MVKVQGWKQSVAAGRAGAAVPDGRLLERARRGDEAAFVALVERHGGALHRLARLHTTDVALAEDAVQDAWVGFLRGLHHFEARASLQTWLCSILLNRLRTRLRRERRCIPVSALPDPPHPPSTGWGASPEACLLADETRAMIDRALGRLPPTQREVVSLRDLEGWGAAEVCAALGITESNQRVLLHRARSRLRRALEPYLAHGRVASARACGPAPRGRA